MATKFVVTVKASGGDYASVEAAEAGLQNDLTAADIKVFSISEYSSGANFLAAGTSVHGGTSGATAVVVLVNVAGTQVLLKTISGTFENGENVHKTDDTNKYVVLSDAGDSPIISIQPYAGVNDTGAVDINGWTTGANNYIEIFVPVSERHAGVWDDNKFRFTTTTTGCINLYPGANYLKATGVQIELASSTGGRGFDVYCNGNTSGWCYISKCIIKHSGTAQNHGGIIKDNASTVTIYAWNNIIYGNNKSGSAGIGIVAGPTAYVYNNTLYYWDSNLKSIDERVLAKNNLSYNASYCYNGTWASGSNYNLASGVTATGGANDKVNQTVAFVDESGRDFHLASNDTAAIDAGVSDPGSGLFSDNIDGETRSGSWDIGADEYVAGETPASPHRRRRLILSFQQLIGVAFIGAVIKNPSLLRREMLGLIMWRREDER